jgi:hypothetical protein
MKARSLGSLVPRAGFVASAITTACCLGLSAAVSLATSVGATFLTRDATLRPLLATVLAITAAGSAWTALRHRSLPPLLLTVIASAVVYSALYGPLDKGIGVTNATSGHAGSHTQDNAMHDAMTTATSSHGGISSTILVWIGLALLLAAQLWDVRRLRYCSVPRATIAHTEGLT